MLNSRHEAHTPTDQRAHNTPHHETSVNRGMETSTKRGSETSIRGSETLKRRSETSVIRRSETSKRNTSTERAGEPPNLAGWGSTKADKRDYLPIWSYGRLSPRTAGYRGVRGLSRSFVDVLDGGMVGVSPRRRAREVPKPVDSAVQDSGGTSMDRDPSSQNTLGWKSDRVVIARRRAPTPQWSRGRGYDTPPHTRPRAKSPKTATRDPAKTSQGGVPA